MLQRCISTIIRHVTGRIIKLDRGVFRYKWQPAKFSHVEICLGEAKHQSSAECVAASERDGRVRRKNIFLDEGNWTIRRYKVPPTEIPAAREYVQQNLGRRYDYIGAIACGLRLKIHKKRSLFCSEFAMGVLNSICREPLAIDYVISPQDFHDILERFNG